MRSDVFLMGGGKMGELIRDKDWSKTSLGSPEQWPLSLLAHIKTMLDNKLGMYIAWGPEFIQIYNDAYRPILGSTKHPHALGISTKETFPEIWDVIGPMFTEVMKGDSVGFSDFMFSLDRNGDGQMEECFFDFSYSPLYHEEGFVGGVFVTVIETTQQVKSIKMLHQNESNLRNLVLNAPVAMCLLLDSDYKVEIANDPMIKFWGTTREAVIKKPIFEGLPEAKDQGLEQLLERVYNTGIAFSATEHKVELPRNGLLETVYVNFSYDPFRDNNGKITGILAVAVDVTKHVETRHKIEESEERARLAIESANIGTYDLDLKLNTIITSPRFDELYGLPSGSTTQDYRNIYHPEDRYIRDNAFSKGLLEGKLSFQLRLLLKDESMRWVRFHGSVYNDTKGKPERIIGTALDISATVEFQQQKDDFLAIASHELKTPLTSIKAYNQLLSSLIKKGDQIISLNIIKKTERQIEKMIKLIHNFLDLSKLENAQLKLQKEDFDLNDLVSETINYYNLPENKERLRFQKAELPHIHADKSKIGHVIDNLLSNALKYSGPNDPVLLTTITHRHSVILCVQDQGRGINESSKEKIFQRFYRADNIVGGTTSGFGIGLYFSSEIIKLHGGKIWFKSNEGEGSTFFFSLPID